MRFVKLIIGLALWPACWALTQLLGRLVRTLSDGALPPTWSMSAWGLWIGFVLWLFIYAVLPRPMRAYVLAHELTHALWGALMGARIKGLRVTDKGGHVKLTRTNFLITLAPYFFPFYTVLVLLLYAVLRLFYDLSEYEPLWFGWVGLTWSFHLTFTLSTLRTHQPDIEEHGRVFSYAVIYLLNVLGLCVWIVTIADLSFLEWATQGGQLMAGAYMRCIDFGRHYGALFYQEWAL